MQLIWTRVWKLNNQNCQIYFPHIFSFVGVFLGSLINCSLLTSLYQIYRKFFWEKWAKHIVWRLCCKRGASCHHSFMINVDYDRASIRNLLRWWLYWVLLGGEEIFHADDWLTDWLLSQMKRRERCWLARLWLERCFVRRMRYKSIRIISQHHLVFL